MLQTRGSGAAAGVAAAPRLPSLCAVCHGWGRGRVCAACLDRFATGVARCARCALPLPGAAPVCGACLTAPPPYDAALAAVDYRAPWDHLVTTFKFHAALELAPLFARLLVRAQDERDAALPRETAHQLALPPAARAGNVRGAVAVEPRRRAEIAGQRIAVVDDVMTTGSTAAELAEVLKQTGTAHVEIWVVANTPRPTEA